MDYRYKIRMFESPDGHGNVAAGTIVRPIDQSFSLFAATADEVERKLCKSITEGKVAAGRIYQICPEFGNAELIRSVAIGSDSKSTRVFLDPANGLYSEHRRVRYPRPVEATVQHEADKV